MRRRVTIEVDGERIEADEGDTVADALLRSGRFTFSRSLKYHRPRGPFCLSGVCDGCLMRVDGRPSVMTCKTACAPGMVVETQNVVGSAAFDVLSVTDAVFPQGMDHHHMFTQNKLVNEAMHTAARQIAGLGRLPDEISEPKSVERLSCDVCVIGAGRSGIRAVIAAAREGHRVLLVDEASRPDDVRGGVVPPAIPFLSATAIGAFRDDAGDSFTLLADRAESAVVVTCRSLVFATGTMPVPLVCPGSDLPRVVSIDAARRMAERGILEGLKTVRVSTNDDSSVEDSLPCDATLLVAQDLAIESKGQSLLVRSGGREVRADLVVVDVGRTSAYALPASLGAEVVWNGVGYYVAADEQGGTGVPGVFAVGSLVSTPSRAARSEALSETSSKRIVCRCEDVTVGEIGRAVEAGYRDMEGVKRYTGLGTGHCQGKMCAALCARAVLGGGGEAEHPTRARPPWRPMELSHLACLNEDES